MKADIADYFNLSCNHKTGKFHEDFAVMQDRIIVLYPLYAVSGEFLPTHLSQKNVREKTQVLNSICFHI